MKRTPLISLISIIAAITAIFSLYMIASILINGSREQNAFDELSAIVEQERVKQNISDNKPQVPEEAIHDNKPQEAEKTIPFIAGPCTEDNTEPAILPEYEEVYNQNIDFFGWLYIPDTSINYPVMHTPDNPEYYLHRAFNGKSAYSGTPFLDAACYEGCGNYIIYGHNMKNGTMFGKLPKFARKEYWEKHKMICFDTLYEHGEYEIVAAFYGKVISEGEPDFCYYKYTDLTEPTVFEEYMEQVKAAAIYETGITAEYGDVLITLSTCSYHTSDGRFVVVAKRTP